jgi:hypothetical protein
MKLITFVAFVALIAGRAIAQDPGMYVDQAGSLVKMQHARAPEVGTKGVVKSMFVPGVMPAGVWIYPGTTSGVPTSSRPRFTYQVRPNQEVRLDSLVLIRLDRKGDRREVRFVRTSAWTGNTRSGFDAKNTVELVSKRDGNVIQLSPAADLAPGEYLLTADSNPIGYDFTVSK